MSRPKPNKASPYFTSYGYRGLSDEATSALIKALGYRLADLAAESVPHQLEEIILAVERALGIYTDGAQHLDHIPRPTHYVNAFRPIERQARKLSETLFDMGQYFSDELLNRGVDSNSFAAELVNLAETSKAIIRDFSGKSSKGRRKNIARAEVIKRLLDIFRSNYQGPLKSREHRGGLQFAAEWEHQEFAFVRTALKDADIPANSNELPRLIRAAKNVHNTRRREQ